jgi:hypothetical protein
MHGEAGAHLLPEPLTYIRCVGRYMHGGPDDRVLARHDMGLWRVGEQSFITLILSGPVLVTFHGSEDTIRRDYGPFTGLHFTEGYMKVGDDFRSAIAHFRDVPEIWTLAETSEEMSIVTIRPATSA